METLMYRWQVPTNQSIQKPVDVPQVQFIDKTVHAPVIMQKQVLIPSSDIDNVRDLPGKTQTEFDDTL